MTGLIRMLPRISAVNQGNSNIQNLPVLDIEKENRLSRIISLCSKGLTQAEIAQELGVDQSTVSRDLQFIKQEAKKKIEKYLNEDILFEYWRTRILYECKEKCIRN